MDSQLVINHLNGQYRIKAENLKPYYKTARVLKNKYQICRLKSTGRLNNKKADELSKTALKYDKSAYFFDEY